MTTLHAGRFVKLTEYHPARAESGRTIYVDPTAVIAIGEGCDNHDRTGRTTWLDVRSGPNGRICVLEPIASVLELFASAAR
jgi:hypothetical protein